MNSYKKRFFCNPFIRVNWEDRNKKRGRLTVIFIEGVAAQVLKEIFKARFTKVVERNTFSVLCLANNLDNGTSKPPTDSEFPLDFYAKTSNVCLIQMISPSRICLLVYSSCSRNRDNILRINRSLVFLHGNRRPTQLLQQAVQFKWFFVRLRYNWERFICYQVEFLMS